MRLVTGAVLVVASSVCFLAAVVSDWWLPCAAALGLSALWGFVGIGLINAGVSDLFPEQPPQPPAAPPPDPVSANVLPLHAWRNNGA